VSRQPGKTGKKPSGNTIVSETLVKQEQKTPKKVGRPPNYTPEVASIICLRLAHGESLKQITLSEGMPKQSTVYEWLIRYPEFAESYARAREEQADTLADEIIAIADEVPEVVPVIDKRTGELIEHKLDNAFLQWQKNRIDARKWTAMKLKPKKYGDRVALTGAADGAPIQVESRHVFDTVLKNLEATRQIEVNDD
jgi:hypothetical protein